MQCLEDKYPEPPLLPQDLQKKALSHQVIVGSTTPFFMIATTLLNVTWLLKLADGNSGKNIVTVIE